MHLVALMQLKQNIIPLLIVKMQEIYPYNEQFPRSLVVSG